MSKKTVKVRLSKGCHERIQAQTGVSLIENKNTKKDLARVTTKVWSKTQTVTNGHVGQIIWGFEHQLRLPRSEVAESEKDRVQSSPRCFQVREKTYDD